MTVLNEPSRAPSQKSGVPSARGKIEDAVTGLYASRV